jgi:hypothetical protein
LEKGGGLWFFVSKNYRHFQRECKRQVRKAEWAYINDTIMEVLENNNLKPFWKYIKARKQDTFENQWATSK